MYTTSKPKIQGGLLLLCIAPFRARTEHQLTVLISGFRGNSDNLQLNYAIVIFDSNYIVNYQIVTRQLTSLSGLPHSIRGPYYTHIAFIRAGTWFLAAWHGYRYQLNLKRNLSNCCRLTREGFRASAPNKLKHTKLPRVHSLLEFFYVFRISLHQN